MREHELPLSTLAFLYARGELGAEQARRFEERLESERPAQEALCQAVQVAHALEGRVGPLPHPVYRDRVREELKPARGWLGPLDSLWSWLGSRRIYRGHPAFWGLTGALAACVLFGLLGLPLPAPAPAPAPLAAEGRQEARAEEAGRITPAATPVPPVRDVAPSPAQLSAAEIAQTFARLHNSKHLARALEEENRRKVRAEDRRLVRGEDRPLRRLEVPLVVNP